MEFIKGLSTKTKVILIAVIVLIILIIIANVQHAKEEEAARLAEEQAALEAQMLAERQQNEKTYADEWQEEFNREQERLTARYGEAPSGFYWNDNGDLVALSDDSMTAEDVAFAYLRGISMLDFESAQKYSYNSQVVSTYSNFFDEDAGSSYYDQFIRKVYGRCLTSIEVGDQLNSSVFANGDRIISFSIEIMDLSYKDFWTKDKKKLFKECYSYSVGEGDSSKARKRIYDYCLDYYQSEGYKKVTRQIDIVLSKLSNGGWLVTNDADIHKLCSYEDGYMVADYILDTYEAWEDDKRR